jgi:hypothetical protein
VGAVISPLSVQVELDDRVVKTATVSFPPAEQPFRRESFVIQGVAEGPHRLAVRIGPAGNVAASDTAEGFQQVNVAAGINRVDARATFVPGTELSIQFK